MKRCFVYSYMIGLAIAVSFVVAGCARCPAGKDPDRSQPVRRSKVANSTGANSTCANSTFAGDASLSQDNLSDHTTPVTEEAEEPSFGWGADEDTEEETNEGIDLQELESTEPTTDKPADESTSFLDDGFQSETMFCAATDCQPTETKGATPGIVSEKPAKGPYVKVDAGYMVPYTTKIPGTDVTFEMIPVQGGTFKMGSPESEEDREDCEGPQFTVKVDPFWMGKCEVTWAEYKEYLKLVDYFISMQQHKMRVVTDKNRIDAITSPSHLYAPETTYKNGADPHLPAVTATPYAAKQYTKYLSLLTGQFYRLPCEAEWEYACRAGTTTAHYAGNDPEKLLDYEWCKDNAKGKPHKVGEKKPNPWGLHDMLGNVSELTLDLFDEDAYEDREGKTFKAEDVIRWPGEDDNDSRTYRGGSYQDDCEDCRSALRRETEGEDWKKGDPNEPKSPWWYADNPSIQLGFRIVRPLKPATHKEKLKAWSSAAIDINDAAIQRPEEGRGAWGLVDPKLPQAITEVKKQDAAKKNKK